jgi:Co/Zn/Cd efflux system component
VSCFLWAKKKQKTIDSNDEAQDGGSQSSISAHDGHDIGLLGILLHILADALNNLGVIISALVIWLTTYEGRFYADPATSMGISIMIVLSSLPLGSSDTYLQVRVPRS